MKSPSSHKTIARHSKGYQEYVQLGRDERSPCGLLYSEIYAIANDYWYQSFERAPKALRRNRFLSGKVGLSEIAVLEYKCSFSYNQHRRIMARISHESLYDEKITPLIKWPGGKTGDLNFIRKEYPYLIPNNVRHYYEPFLGGGAFWLSMNAEKMFVNDLSTDLMCFYYFLQSQNKDFINHLENLSANWNVLELLAQEKYNDIYIAVGNIEQHKVKHKEGEEELKLNVERKKYLQNILSPYRAMFEETFFSAQFKSFVYPTIFSSVWSKLGNIKRNEVKHSEKLSQEDLKFNIEGALKAGLYTSVRRILNQYDKMTPLRMACFYVMRDYCFSSMFRYNAAGDFNVPYGGISYNSRPPNVRVNHWTSERVVNHLKRTELYTRDFEDFLDQTNPGPEDFIFLDPPYDSDFSTYDKNVFGPEEQTRLAHYIINKCQSKFLAIMKNTPLIERLYSGHPGIQTFFFDKKYSVSFKDRNDKDVEHIVVARM